MMASFSDKENYPQSNITSIFHIFFTHTNKKEVENINDLHNSYRADGIHFLLM